MNFGGAPQKSAHQKKRLLALVCIALPMVYLVFLFWSPSSAEYTTMATEHFAIKYTQRDKKVIPNIVAALEGKYNSVVSDLRPSMQPVIQVTIHSDLKTFHRAIGAPPDAPTWVVGTVGTDGSIQMVSPRKPGPSHTYQSIVSVAVHEMVHSVCMNLNAELADMKWLSESVASYYAGQFRDPKSQPYLQKSEFPSLAELDTTTKHYDVGYVLIDFIIEKWGSDKVRDLIITGGNIPDVLGISVADFEGQWHQFIRMRYLEKTSALPWSRAILAIA